MGLQLRMTHSLGQRLIEVEARKADQAIVVGRASNAEVQIPSANIAKRHCLLFVHEGRWVVQDAQSPSGTFLNGERLTEPAFVNSGDVIALGRGSNPPTLTVDPHSVGVSEEKEEIAPVARVREAAQPKIQRSAPVAPMPGAGMPPPMMPPQPAPARGFIQAEDPDDIFGAPVATPGYGAPAGYGAPGGYAPPGNVPGYGAPVAPPVDEWGNAFSAASDKPRRRKVVKQQGLSGTAIAITAVVSVVIVAVATPLIINIYKKSKEDHIITAPNAAAPPTTQQKPKANSIFEDDPNMPRKGKTGSADTPAPAVAAASPVIMEVKAAPKVKLTPMPAATPEIAPAVDTRRDDPEWDAIESARSAQRPVLAVWKYHDYMDRFPDNPNKKDIEKYTNDALDIIWWTRLNELFVERDAAQQEIRSRKADIAISQDADFKKMLEKEIANFTQRREEVNATIHDQMKFSGEKAPSLYDASDLAIARKTRDEKYYEETWKPQVLHAITSSHGDRLPWKSSR